MSYREIRVIGDPVLRTPCEWITDIDDHVKHLVEDLLENVDQTDAQDWPHPRLASGCARSRGIRRRHRIRSEPEAGGGLRGRVPRR